MDRLRSLQVFLSFASGVAFANALWCCNWKDRYPVYSFLYALSAILMAVVVLAINGEKDS